MAQSRKPATSRPRSGEADKYRAELTSSQLVIGICILMLFGLACFLIGVLVGKFDAAPLPAQVASAEPPVQAKTVRLAPPEPEPEHEPQTVQTPVEPAKRPQEPGIPDSSGIESPAMASPPETATPAEPGIVELPEPEEPPLAAAVPETQPAPTTLPEQTVEPVATEAAEQEPEVEVPPTVEPETLGTPAPPAVPEDDALEPAPDRVGGEPLPVDLAATGTAGQFTVQIGAFSKQANAELAKKRIESSSSLPVYLVNTRQGGLIKVHVGEFATQSAAEVAKAELRDKLGYSDSVVTKHAIAFTQAPAN